MPDDAHPMGDPPDEMVPEYWPSARSDTPRPARTIHGLFALPGFLLLWIVPKRVGASLAASGWRAAVVAHVLAMALGGGLILWTEMYNWSSLSANFWAASWAPNVNRPIVSVGQLPWTDCVRGPFAALALWAHGSGIGAGGIARGLLTLLWVEASFVLVAVGVMPWATAGESARGLFGRCLRLTWWSTTFIIPLGFGWLLDPLIRPKLGLPPEWHPFDYIALSVTGLLWLSILLRSTRRYAGPAEGPAWTPRTPWCESCGYTISHLPHTTNCPECGRPVVDSLPSYRQVSPFELSRGLPGRVRGYCSTVRRALFDKQFFSRLAVHTEADGAKTFLLVTILVNATLLVVTVPLLDASESTDPVLIHSFADAAVVASASILAQVIVSGLLATGVAVVTRRPLYAAATTTFYGLTGFLMGMVGLIVLVWAPWLLARAMDRPTIDPVFASLGVLVGAVGLTGIALTPFILRRAIRQTRYPNA